MNAVTPIFFSDRKEIYILDKDWELKDVTSNVPVETFICFNVFDITPTYDISFFEFLVTSTNRKEEFGEELEILKKIRAECVLQNIESIKKILLYLKELSYSEKLIALVDRYRSYYEEIIIPILHNTLHFNTQRFYLKSEAIVQLEEDERALIRMDGLKPYLPISIIPYNWSVTGRLNAAIFSQLSKFKNFLIPKNDLLLEIDCVAAEWNFLIHCLHEGDKAPTDKRNYWQDLLMTLTSHWSSSGLLDKDRFKRMLYMTLYGAGVEEICSEIDLEERWYYSLLDAIKMFFPKTFAFYKLESENKYISKGSNIIYDFFGKEMYVDSNYKKLNFFLQSSLSSHFQKFVHKVIGEMGKRGFQSKILLTIHDSVFVDIVVSEREEIFKIMREQNEYPPFMLNVKSLIKKVPDG